MEQGNKFKDIAGSKEEQLQGKIGVFKSIPFYIEKIYSYSI